MTSSSYRWPEEEAEEIFLSREHFYILLKEEAEASEATYSKFDEFLRALLLKKNHHQHLPHEQPQSTSSFVNPAAEHGEVVNDTSIPIQYKKNHLAGAGSEAGGNCPPSPAGVQNSLQNDASLMLATTGTTHTYNHDDAEFKLKLQLVWHNVEPAAAHHHENNLCFLPRPSGPKPTNFNFQNNGTTTTASDYNQVGLREMVVPTVLSNPIAVSEERHHRTSSNLRDNIDTAFLRAKCSKGVVPPELEQNLRSLKGEHNLVDHTYFDFSLVDDSLITDESIIIGQNLKAALKAEEMNFTNCIMISSRIMRNIQIFPMRLMDMLSRSEVSSVITWLPHGRSFIVRDPKTLEDDLIPRFFKPMKFKSFLRQVNLWGFKRITRGADSGAYYHQLFLRQKPGLVRKMSLVKCKYAVKGMRPVKNPSDEPNFYELAKIRPLLGLDETPAIALPPRSVGDNAYYLK
mmetsp:Transcript_3934/g.6014  ORF Transcript_3934/g.6014 Transcript_3934/m.6014 type:complete len:459 (+) Transcript_3934:77-1453(+)|eukprot:CAMPEP_0196815426 /NCGR_PEP_ID=MMETSP1362-20130617/49684_1 /TAXON_ID=163516 /ORGANISM="Leptocylindrus danicus, Strain CCMP1856" /LENGTH=458 /DNA_ID=CAMNT_0042192375 /DNA_START=59 /DNA_END=1435 /DNA_ORIENTATION=-